MNIHYQDDKARFIANTAIIAGIYVVVTFITAPFAFGPLNFRVAEGLNFLGLYNRKHILSVALGVFISNYFAYGPVDMIVGTLSTLIFVYIGQWLSHYIVNKMQPEHLKNIDPMLIKYLIMAIFFSLSMISIALMIKFLGYQGPFIPLYLGMVLSEFIAMVLGGFIIYPLSKRINLYQ